MTLLDVDVNAAPVRAAFASLRARLRNMAPAWAQIGARMESAAVPLVPVESGALVDSLRVDAGPAGVEVFSELIYAGVQDAGWPAHNIEGHHFMDRAEESAENNAADLLAPSIQQLINRVGL